MVGAMRSLPLHIEYILQHFKHLHGLHICIDSFNTSKLFAVELDNIGVQNKPVDGSEERFHPKTPG